MVELSITSSRRTALREGAVFVYPTDTAYGLGAWVYSPEGVQRVFELKDRPVDKTVPVLATRNQGKDLVQMEPAEQRAADQFWPGELTLVLTARDPDAFPPGIVRDGTLALRVPGYDPLLKLLEKVGPITGTSANPSGGRTPSRREDLDPGLVERVDFVLGDHAGTGDSSTVAEWDDHREEWTLHREGPVGAEDLRSLIDS